MDSFDFKMRKPEQVVNSVMTKLKKHGKGIVLMHDFQQATSQAVPEMLAQLKAGGYKIVHMKARDAVATLPQYDEEMRKDAEAADRQPAPDVERGAHGRVSLHFYRPLHTAEPRSARRDSDRAAAALLCLMIARPLTGAETTRQASVAFCC